MAVTTWTFTSNFEGWTFAFNDVPGDLGDLPGKSFSVGAGTARTHVSGAIRNTLVIENVADVCTITNNYSPTLNTTIQNGDTIAVDYSAASDSDLSGIGIIAHYTDATTETINTSSAVAGTVTLTLTQNKTLDFIRVRLRRCTSGTATGSTHSRDILEVRLTTAAAFIGTGERPLELDVDLFSGAKIWKTKWKAGGLYLEEHSSGLVLQNTFPIATGTTATTIEIDNRTYYLTPYAPPFFGAASLEDIIYIFGRWDDGSVRHLQKSIDGGSSFSDIGDSGTWGAGWVGGFFADDANILYAFVNGASRALYRSIDAGSNWTNLSSLPFDVEAGGVSKHPDGRILIINRDTGAQMAAYAEAPDYSSWIDATGSPTFPMAGGGANSVIWIT